LCQEELGRGLPKLAIGDLRLVPPIVKVAKAVEPIRAKKLKDIILMGHQFMNKKVF
jgi:hypothetical protein